MNIGDELSRPPSSPKFQSKKRSQGIIGEKVEYFASKGQFRGLLCIFSSLLLLLSGSIISIFFLQSEISKIKETQSSQSREIEINREEIGNEKKRIANLREDIESDLENNIEEYWICNNSREGIIYLNREKHQFEECHGNKWILSMKYMGRSCLEIITKYPRDVSGIDAYYPIILRGEDYRLTYCDMSTDGGGFTLVAEHKSTELIIGPNAPFIFNIHDLNLTYSHVLFVAGAYFLSNYDNYGEQNVNFISTGFNLFYNYLLIGGEKWYLNREENIFGITDCGERRYYGMGDIRVLERALHCGFGLRNMPQYCGKLVLFPAFLGGRLEGVGDIFTECSTYYDETLYIPHFHIYVR